MPPVRQTARLLPAPGLATQLQYLKGVGPERAKLLARKGLTTVEEALFFLPIRHEDRTRLTSLRSLQVGQVATCTGTIAGISPPPPGRRRGPSGAAAARRRRLRHRDPVRPRLAHARPAARAARDPARQGRPLQGQDHAAGAGLGGHRLHRRRAHPCRRAGARSTPPRRGCPSARCARCSGGSSRRTPPTSPRRCPSRSGAGATSSAFRSRCGARTSRHSEDERGAAIRRLAFEDFLLLQLGLAILRSRTTAGSRHRAEPAGRAREPSARGAAVVAHRRPGAGVDGDPRRHGRAPPDAPAAPGRRRLRQDHRGRAGRAHRGRGRLSGGGDGADRDPGRAALHDALPAAAAAGRARHAAHLGASARASGAPRAGRPGRRRDRLRHRHPRPRAGARGVPPAGAGGGGRAASLRRRPACACSRPRASSPTCS